MNAWAVEVFYDGGCPLCMREIRFLRRLDKQGRIRFTDIDDRAFDFAAIGKDRPTLMGRIHARSPDGEWFEGVEVFRRLYDAVGFHALVAASRWFGVRHLLSVCYAVFARNRLRLTGRCSDDACRVPA